MTLPKIESTTTALGSVVSTLDAAVHRRLILKNFLALSTGSAAERVVSLFTSIYARRVLGVLAIGQISWTATIIAYCGLLVNPGLQIIAKREVARDSNQAGRYAILLTLLEAGLATVAFGFAVAFSLAVPLSSEVRALLILQAVGLFLIPLDLSWLLQARERMAILASANVAINVLQALFLVLLVHEPSDIVRYVLLAYPFRLALYGFMLYYSVRHKLLAWCSLRSALVGGWDLMRAGFPIGLSQVAILLYYNSDSIFLGFTHGAEAVGLYSTAYNLMLVPILLTGALINTYFPILSRVANDPKEARRVSEEFLKIMVWLGFPIAALGWAVGRYILVLLFGEAYAQAGPLFEWLSLDIALIFFNTAYGWPLNAWGAQKLTFMCTLAGAVTNVAANFVLIPRFGTWGAVATTLLAELAVMVVTIWIRRRFYPAAWRRLVLTGIAICVPAAVLTRWVSMQTYWYLALPLGLVVCGGGILRFERQAIRSVLRNGN